MRTTLMLMVVGMAGLAVVAAPVPKTGQKLPPPTAAELRKSKYNLKQIMLAMHNFHDATGVFPADLTDGNGKPILSWRVLLLPYMEEDPLFKKFKLDEPWDGESNKKLLEEIPSVYAPLRVKPKTKGETYYCGFAGEGTVFEPGVRVKFTGIFDGTSNTVGVVEAGEPVLWTKPGDISYDANKPFPKLGGLFDDKFHVALCDGSVRVVDTSAWNPDDFRKTITRAGGEVVDLNQAFGSPVKK